MVTIVFSWLISNPIDNASQGVTSETVYFLNTQSVALVTLALSDCHQFFEACVIEISFSDKKVT
jgi:hypothetical protein